MIVTYPKLFSLTFRKCLLIVTISTSQIASEVIKLKNTKLIELRRSLGKSQREIASKIGISRSMYAMIELGTRIGSYPTMKLIADYLDHSVDEIFGESLFVQNAHKMRHPQNTA